MNSYQLNHVIVSNGGDRDVSISHDSSAYEYAASLLARRLEEEACENAKFIRMEAKSGNPKKAVERFIDQTGDGRLERDLYIISRHPTVQIPD